MATNLTKVICGDDTCYFDDSEKAEVFADVASAAPDARAYDKACTDHANEDGEWDYREAVARWGDDAVEDADELFSF